MSIFELYVPNTERWRGVFKKTGVPVPDAAKVDVQSGGKGRSSVQLVTPTQQMIQAAKSELKSPVHYDREGMAHSDSPAASSLSTTSKRVKPAGAAGKKRKPARRQVRSAPSKKKTKRPSPAAPKKKKSAAASPKKKRKTSPYLSW